MVRALLGHVLTLGLVSVLAFSLLSLTPGDPARMALAAAGADQPTPEEVAAKRAELGLDAPVLARYAGWVAGALRGDFGRSYRTGRPVLGMLAERAPATLLLAGVALLLTLATALPLGIVAALQPGRVADHGLHLLATLGAALPGFWLALCLMLIFSATLRWLPALGSPTLAGIALPALVLALPHIALQSRLVRASALDVLSQRYMLMARAKGLRGAALAWRHLVPAVLPALATPLALETAYLITGTVIVESVFGYPGVGRLAVDAALIGDMPLLALWVWVAATVHVGCAAGADALTRWLNPRARPA